MSPTIFILGSVAMMAVTSQCFDLSAIPSNESANPRAEEANCLGGETALPGRTISPQQQCMDRRRDHFKDVCTDDDPAEMCVDLKCTDGRGDIPDCEATGPALDGTRCGDKKICCNGKCVDDRE